MARDIAIRHFRGLKADLPVLEDGEFGFTIDTAEVFVGYAGLNFNLGVRGMANVIVQGSANPSHFIEPNADGSINIVAGSPLSVTGTFFQATQPVSIAATVNVDGSAHTQPVSGTITANAGSGTFITDDLAASVVGSAPPANAMYIGGNKAGVLTGLTLDANNNLNVNISDVGGNAAVAKGVQPALAIPTQDMKDSGRSKVVLTLTKTASITTEALVALTQKKGDATTTTGTSYTVTAGKTLRIQSMLLSATLTTATLTAVAIRLREGAAGGGAVSTASDIIAELEVSAGQTTVTIGQSGQQLLNFPDGLELAGGQIIGASELATSLVAAVTIVIIGYEY